MKLSSLATLSLALLLGLGLLVAGCANGPEKTYEREVVEEYHTDHEGDIRHYEQTVEEEKHVDADDDDYCDGVLGCTFEVVGDVIALPFRVVAGVVEVVF